MRKRLAQVDVRSHVRPGSSLMLRGLAARGLALGLAAGFLAPWLPAGLIASAAAATTTGSTGKDPALLARFNKAFADELAQLRASPNSRSEGKFAQNILDRAGQFDEDPAFYAFVLDKAYEFGMKHAAGYRWAAESREKLAKADPARTLHCFEGLADIYSACFQDSSKGTPRYGLAGRATCDMMSKLAELKIRRGDFKGAIVHLNQAKEIAYKCDYEALKTPLKDRLADAQAMAAIQTRLESAKFRHERNPDDKTILATLFNLYFQEMDDPQMAAQYAELGLAEPAKLDLVPVAVFELGYGKPEQYLELAEWYLQLSASASKPAKPKMLIRARLHAEQYMGNGASGLERIKGERIIQQANSGLQSAGMMDSAINKRLAETRNRLASTSILDTVAVAPPTPPEDKSPKAVKPRPEKPEPATPKPTPSDPKPKPEPVKPLPADPKPAIAVKPESPATPAAPAKASKMIKIPPPNYEKDLSKDAEEYYNKKSIFEM